MTGKELLLALVGAGLVGGAAGAGASLATAPKVEPPDTTASDLLAARLKAAETQLAEARSALDASRKSLNELQERVTASELKAAAQAADVAAAAPKIGGKRLRLGRGGAVAVDGDKGPDDKELAEVLGAIDFEQLGGNVGIQLGKAFEGLGEQLGAQGPLGGFVEGMKLRQIPEAQRWDKARDELNLSWSQVEELKKAVADRDAAVKEATSVEKKTGPAGGALTIQRVSDPGKIAHAQAAYHDKVKSTLDEGQRKSWNSKGYDHAFGEPAIGGIGQTMVMKVDVSAHDDDPKDAK
jgi:hypothetical protein